ncbi:MAG: 4-(cytidine 5'-diphospho)-2-C-methyl-D-erythritol kinase, partial [Bacteroidales bacterium]|nr:4-(cytidine 5'-diphospho)-2-C-methyl-D-erythritol kinase [Bacteroidales bacterium]
MVLFPYCKINLGLQIVAKRPDGFHDLDTVFLPVREWYDVLEILPAGRDEFILSGAPLEGEPADNLVCRAREAMRRHLAQQGRTLPACSLRLHKTVPSGAGLGGGSSDATHTLIGLNQLFALGLSVSDIEALSRPLGSDCAFFSADEPARATGKGDVLERLTPDADAPDCHLWIVVPPVHISTPQAYAGARPQAGRPTLPQLLRRPVAEWPQCIENDFEKTLFP